MENTNDIVIHQMPNGIIGNRVYLTDDKDFIAKNANQEIVKSDIEPYNNWFWGEVSGPIEHYFKKHGGNPIPKELAPKFLNKKNIVLNPNPNDLVHYTRKIANLEDPIEKAIYGFKDEAMAKEVMESIDNYEDFKISVNSQPDKMNESEFSNSLLEDALVVVIQVVDMHEEFGFNEMLPHWHKALTNAVLFMEKHINNISNKDKLVQVKSSINIAKHLLEEMPLLTIHKFTTNS